MNDTEIIAQIKNGNPDKAIGKMYSQLSVFRRFVKSCGGNKEEADDIFQEALLVFCKKVGKEDFVLSSALNTFLLAIAKYMFKDSQRKKNKTLSVSIEEIPEIKLATEEHEEETHDLESAAEILKGLGERCLELLENFYFRKMSMKEIADKMKFSSEKIAKNQKYKCLERARNKLGDRG